MYRDDWEEQFCMDPDDSFVGSYSRTELQPVRYKGKPGNPWEDLAQAIIRMAAMDYMHAQKGLRRRHSQRDEELRDECLVFFRSEMFGRLTKVDPDWLIRALDLVAGGHSLLTPRVDARRAVPAGTTVHPADIRKTQRGESA